MADASVEFADGDVTEVDGSAEPLDQNDPVELAASLVPAPSRPLVSRAGSAELPARAVVVAAAGGAVAGAASVALASMALKQMRGGAKRGAARSRTGRDRAAILASRSFLIDVHLLRGE